MKRTNSLVLFLFFCLLIASCSSTIPEIKFSVDANPKFILRGYQSYTWHNATRINWNEGDQWSLSDFDIASETRALINRELHKRTLSEVADNPDIQVGFTTGADLERLEFKTDPAVQIPEVENFNESALIIFMIDNDSEYLLWIGSADIKEQLIKDPDEVKDYLEFSVTHLMKTIL